MMVLFLCAANGQVTIECVVQETITGPECMDCTNGEDTAYIHLGLRCINATLGDTVLLEAPIRLKTRDSVGIVVLFDYRQNPSGFGNQTFSFHVDSSSQFSTVSDVIDFVRDCASFTVSYGTDSTRVIHWGETISIRVYT